MIIPLDAQFIFLYSISFKNIFQAYFLSYTIIYYLY
jgi:hypothetical protein